MPISTSLHQHSTHPWTDQHEHLVTLDIARKIASDVVLNERWGAGNEGQPVYDVSGEGSGWYVGDYADDAVRCNMAGRIVLNNRHSADLGHMTEVAYRALLPRAVEWLRLHAYLAKLVEVSRLEADESVDAAAARMIRNGYTVEKLREELNATEAV